MRRAGLIVVGLALVYGAVPLLLGGSSYLMRLLVAAVTIGNVAIAWALLGNLGGMVSFGHSAFFGIGGYVSALLAQRMGVPVFAAMLLGGFGATIASVAMMPALRLRGPYFALAILAYAQIFRILATELAPITGGAAGLTSLPRLPSVLGVDFGTNTGNYLVIVTLGLAFTVVYWAIRRSDHGLALRAMHESEDATRVLGVDSTLLKAGMLLLSAFMTGMVGAFNAHVMNFLEPDYAFDSEWTIVPIVAAVVGGYRTLAGPMAGAVGVYLLDQLVFKGFMPRGHQFVLGALLVTMVIFGPRGVVPVLRRRVLSLRWWKGGGGLAGA